MWRIGGSAAFFRVQASVCSAESPASSMLSFAEFDQRVVAESRQAEGRQALGGIAQTTANEQKREQVLGVQRSQQRACVALEGLALVDEDQRSRGFVRPTCISVLESHPIGQLDRWRRHGLRTGTVGHFRGHASAFRQRLSRTERAFGFAECLPRKSFEHETLAGPLPRRTQVDRLPISTGCLEPTGGFIQQGGLACSWRALYHDRRPGAARLGVLGPGENHVEFV